MTTPRLLNRDQAREYLGGARPDEIAAPLRIGGRIVWDRFALDRELDRLSGLDRRVEPSGVGEGLKRAQDRLDAKAKGRAGSPSRRP